MSKQVIPVAASIESEIDMEKNDNNSHNAYTASNKARRMGSGNLLISLVLLMVQMCGQVQAWGGNNQNTEADYSIYGNAATRDWLYDGSTLSIQVLGCVWGIVYDSEEAGCLEDESEDGTYNWYMMANCRRPQVAYAVYSSSSCSNNYFVGSVSDINGITGYVSTHALANPFDSFYQSCMDLVFTLFSSLRNLTSYLFYYIVLWYIFDTQLFYSVHDNNGSF